MRRSLDVWLTSVRRRIRLRRGLRWAVAGVIAWAGAALVIMVAARIIPLGWERSVAAFAAAAVVIAAMAGVFKKLPRFLAARAADNDLSAADRIGTAVDLLTEGRTAGLAPAQIAGATKWAAASSVGKASPIRIPMRRSAVALGLSAVVGALFLIPNPMDRVIEKRRAEAAILKERAADLQKKAEEIERSDISPEEKKKLVEELNELAKKVASSESIDQALKELAKLEGKLSELQKSDHLELKALAKAFERNVEGKPLASGVSGKTPEQLRQLAELLPQLSQSEKEDAAQRLEAFAKSLENSDPETAAALKEAAGALKEGGDPEALRGAAEKLDEAAAKIAAQDEIAASRADLGDLREELADAKEALENAEGTRAGEAEGQSPDRTGRPGNEGEGQGQRGEGQSPGQNQGGAQNQQGQRGAGSPSGTVSGANSPTADPATGGPGTPSGSGNNPSTEVSESEVFDPIFGNTAERIQAEGERQAGGRETTVGNREGGGAGGPVTVPYRSVYPAWSARAARTVQTLPIPASLRSYVRSYFASLAPPPSP
jgi:tetratricopeptide (TPR) repeat protein